MRQVVIGPQIVRNRRRNQKSRPRFTRTTHTQGSPEEPVTRCVFTLRSLRIADSLSSTVRNRCAFTPSTRIRKRTNSFMCGSWTRSEYVQRLERSLGRRRRRWGKRERKREGSRKNLLVFSEQCNSALGGSFVSLCIVVISYGIARRTGGELRGDNFSLFFAQRNFSLERCAFGSCGVAAIRERSSVTIRYDVAD